MEINGVHYVAKPTLNLSAIHSEGKCFPENADGHIVSPIYSVDPNYRAKVLAWAEANPKRLPTWLIHDLSVMRRTKPSSAGQNSTEGSKPSTQPTETEADETRR